MIIEFYHFYQKANDFYNRKPAQDYNETLQLLAAEHSPNCTNHPNANTVGRRRSKSMTDFDLLKENNPHCHEKFRKKTNKERRKSLDDSCYSGKAIDIF
ncbi:MAG: hypothetical protein GY782_12635 [Gammaproteobacteria bacterium]|nr:hypothetical protein [Gammaproteobacteria bacterium]